MYIRTYLYVYLVYHIERFRVQMVISLREATFSVNSQKYGNTTYALSKFFFTFFKVNNTLSFCYDLRIVLHTINDITEKKMNFPEK